LKLIFFGFSGSDAQRIGSSRMRWSFVCKCLSNLNLTRTVPNIEEHTATLKRSATIAARDKGIEAGKGREHCTTDVGCPTHEA
jgi:hypothetical protein